MWEDGILESHSEAKHFLSFKCVCLLLLILLISVKRDEIFIVSK